MTPRRNYLRANRVFIWLMLLTAVSGIACGGFIVYSVDVASTAAKPSANIAALVFGSIFVMTCNLLLEQLGPLRTDLRQTMDDDPLEELVREFNLPVFAQVLMGYSSEGQINMVRGWLNGSVPLPDSMQARIDVMHAAYTLIASKKSIVVAINWFLVGDDQVKSPAGMLQKDQLDELVSAATAFANSKVSVR